MATSLLVKYLILLALGHFNIIQWESPVNKSSESKFLDSGRLDYPTKARCILDNFGQAISCRSWGIQCSSCKCKSLRIGFVGPKNHALICSSTQLRQFGIRPAEHWQVFQMSWHTIASIHGELTVTTSCGSLRHFSIFLPQDWKDQNNSLQTGAGCRSIATARSLFWDLRHVQITVAPVVISAVTIWVFSKKGIQRSSPISLYQRQIQHLFRETILQEPPMWLQYITSEFKRCKEYSELQ